MRPAPLQLRAPGEMLVETERHGRRWAWAALEPVTRPNCGMLSEIVHPFATCGTKVGDQHYTRVEIGWAWSEERARAKARRAIGRVHAYRAEQERIAASHRVAPC